MTFESKFCSNYFKNQVTPISDIVSGKLNIGLLPEEVSF